MGFFSDFLTWLKGRNLCPSLMNDKQELEKLGEYEEENGGIGTYLHRVVVSWDASEDKTTGKSMTAVYLLTSTKKEEIFVDRAPGEGITERLGTQGFVFSDGDVYDNETNGSFELACVNSFITTHGVENITGITYEYANQGTPAEISKLFEVDMLVTYRETIEPV